ncbi:acyl-CoA thioester hydrolase/BAAT C-terminal domain-containing protein [Anaerococcus sp. Marseille-Q7828]|uniref:acyl-CoA thioester hydrolase/BAAT C-terminal domain-containing protein n=1 Tax=Anaerococcus sp. Marseille-Q7828 TaxID=3036300 RepID=UPI0032C218BB
MLIAGKEDQLWDSLSMANQIKSKLPDEKLLSYKDAGHIFAGNGILNLDNMRINTGGTLDANQKAKIESDAAIENFLKDHHEH